MGYMYCFCKESERIDIPDISGIPVNVQISVNVQICIIQNFRHFTMQYCLPDWNATSSQSCL